MSFNMADQDEPKTECSSYEMKVITETFQMFDRDNSGVIDMKEMTNVLGALNVTNNDETIQVMFTNMDKVFSKFFISVFSLRRASYFDFQSTSVTSPSLSRSDMLMV